MERIVIIGCGGAGKSTLARQLGKKLNIPVVHLDKLWWKPGWVESSREEIDALPTIGRRDGRFGTEAIVRRTDIPAGMKTGAITIEDLFVFMAKEEGR